MDWSKVLLGTFVLRELNSWKECNKFSTFSSYLYDIPLLVYFYFGPLDWKCLMRLFDGGDMLLYILFIALKSYDKMLATLKFHTLPVT